MVLNEIQRVPRLFDMVHLLIERDKFRFILTGSSARKLKRGAAHLLAGRAFLEIAGHSSGKIINHRKMALEIFRQNRYQSLDKRLS